jgi:hypothetical protein
LFRRWLIVDALIFAIVFSFAAQICVFSAMTRQTPFGEVYGANGPIAGAFVSADGDNGSASAITDGSGHYTMSKGLKTGTYNVTTFAYGYIDDEVDFVNVTATQTHSGVDLDMKLSGAISGTVTDAINGTPINDTFVDARSAAGNRFGFFATSGTNGKYLMATDLPTDMYNVSITAPDGYIVQSVLANVTAGVETKNVNFPLARSGILSGKVAAPNGTGLSGIGVSAISSGGGTPYYGFATTDSSGNYRIATGLGTDNYTVYASGDGNFTYTTNPIMVTAGLETSGVNLELTPFIIPPAASGTITGRVTDQSNGNPIKSATVTAFGSGYGSAETDSNGYYNISSGLGNANDYNVSATASGYYDAYYSVLITVTVGLTTSGINIQMTAAPAELYGTITGTVTGAANPIPEFQYPIMAMLSLTLVAAVASKMMLKTKRYKNAKTVQ